jgi:hypothetical protein
MKNSRRCESGVMKKNVLKREKKVEGKKSEMRGNARCEGNWN